MPLEPKTPARRGLDGPRAAVKGLKPSHSNKLQCAGMPAVCGREDKMKKQPEIHSRVKYFKALIGDGVTPKDRTKARQRKKGRK